MHDPLAQAGTLYVISLIERYQHPVSTGAFRCPTPLPLCQHLPTYSFLPAGTKAAHLLPASPQPPRNMVPLLSVVTTNSHLTNCPCLDHTPFHSPDTLSKTRRAPCCTGLAQWASPRCQGPVLHSVSQGCATESSGNSEG